MFRFRNKRKDHEDYEDEEYLYDDEYDDEYDDDDYDEYDDGYDDEDYDDDEEYDDYPKNRKEEFERPRRRRPAPVKPTPANNHSRYNDSYEGRGGYAPQEPSREGGQNHPVHQELQRLDELQQRLTQQLEVKQNEVSQLTQLLTEKEEENTRTVKNLQEELTSVKRQLENQKKHADEQLSQYQQQIQTLEAQSRDQETMKSDLANIIIETKEQGRDIVERAQWEADRIKERAEIDARKLLADASLELRMVKQEATQYRDRIASMKEESSLLFDKLLASSEQLIGQDNMNL